MHKELKIYGNVAERFSKRFLAIKLLEKDVEIERMVKRWGNYSRLMAVREKAINTIQDLLQTDSETAFTDVRYGFISGALQRISFETLKGVGKASGTAFRFMFMGAHMAVENHGEVIGEFLQRRVNFIVSALGSINPTEFSKASQTIDIETELVPYMIDDLNDKVTTAVSAVSGGVWSRREGIMFAGNADRVEEELAEIKEEQAAKNNNAASPNSKG